MGRRVAGTSRLDDVGKQSRIQTWSHGEAEQDPDLIWQGSRVCRGSSACAARQQKAVQGQEAATGLQLERNLSTFQYQVQEHGEPPSFMGHLVKAL